MKTSLYILIMCAILHGVARTSYAQERMGQREIVNKVMFWNCENLFDTENDSLRQDDDYTPEGARHWTSYRQYVKLMNISRVIDSFGSDSVPAIIGLAEVENDSVMRRLTRGTPLYRHHYKYVMTQSDDVRGINVALMYLDVEYKLLGWESLKVSLGQVSASGKEKTHKPLRQPRPTRDILHAWGRVIGGDTLDVIVCHLPSRLGGRKNSLPMRKQAHLVIHSLTDSLSLIRTNPKILVMGDMNDTPYTRQLCKDMRFGSGLHNLMQPLDRALRLGKIPFGSHKYQGRWSWLDQFWVNDALFVAQTDNPATGNRVWVSDANCLAHDYMLAEDVAHLGHRPLRTYYGYRYEGGFSDHLPIVLDLHLRFRSNTLKK
ncbi:MAG: endonuclease [Bacteroidales bacterium]|nr:endonuclease [Candidatus Liminaster caballi]